MNENGIPPKRPRLRRHLARSAAVSDITVLVTGAGTTTAISVLKGLRKQRELDVRTIAVDVNPNCVGRYFSDAFYQIPPAKSPDFVDSLLNVCRQEGVGLLVPIVDYEFLPLSLARDGFDSIGCQVVISSVEAVQICNEKDRTHACFAACGIPKPNLYSSDAMLRGQLQDIPFPLVIKPRIDGRGSIDVYKLENAEDLAYWGGRVNDPLFEEYVEGREYTIDTLSDFGGRVVAAVPRERLEVKAGICYKGRTERNADLIEWARRVALAIGIVGPANIQCRVTPAGEIKFFEVNPRFAATLPITIAAGVNMPLLLAQMALGIQVGELFGNFEEIMMFRYWDEVFVPESSAAADELPFGVTQEDVVA